MRALNGERRAAALADDRARSRPRVGPGPKFIDGKPNEGTFRSHQVPLTDPAKNPEHLRQLESWLRSYRPQELFDERGRLKPELAALAPKGDRRMGANPNANGGRLLRDLRMPDFTDYAVDVPKPGAPRDRRYACVGPISCATC